MVTKQVTKGQVKRFDKAGEIKSGLLIAYGELFLKSAGVQKLLKQKLVNNLSQILRRASTDFKVLPLHERIFVQTSDCAQVQTIAKNVAGIAWLASAFYFPDVSLEEIANFIKTRYPRWIKTRETFALRVKRDKAAGYSREEIIQALAADIRRKVNLDNPQQEIFIEARKNGWFVYLNKQKGTGGLPVGSQGKVLTMMSGGIDSPAAAYMIAKRGAQNLWLHFHSVPLVSQKSIEKTRTLARIFLKYQPKIKVLFVPFANIQKRIITSVPPKYRVTFYRRVMFQIAQKIAQKENCEALVTGESLGQVSSQTLTNLAINQERIKMPVFRPLIGFDKEEIIQIAKRIDTYDVSILPHEDCCTLFVPGRQSAQADLEIIKSFEKNLKLAPLISQAIKKTEVEQF